MTAGRGQHYRNRLVCGHRSWLSTTKPEALTAYPGAILDGQQVYVASEYCFPCDQHREIVSELVGGLAHPERVIREPGKYALKESIS